MQIGKEDKKVPFLENGKKCIKGRKESWNGNIASILSSLGYQETGFKND